jgi:stage IV sporulation protein FB
MLFFASPPPTRYDLHFTLAGIPVRVHPLFWLITLLFGASLNNVVLVLFWIAIVFVSILIHELGHAFAMRAFGQPAQVVLHGMGGLTTPEAIGWGSRWATVAFTVNQEILISLAGPGAGFAFAGLLLAVVAAAGGVIANAPLFGIIPYPTALLPNGGWLVNSILGLLLGVNIFWGLINLMPVYPLDGGNVARHLLVKADPWGGVRKSLWLSLGAGVLLAVAGLFLMGSLYVALLFGLLALQSYLALQGRAF